MQSQRALPFLLSVLCAALGVSCGRSRAAEPVAIRLVDLFKPEAVAGKTTAAPRIPRTEWRFAGPSPEPPPSRNRATRGWEGGPGVAAVSIRDGLLVGQATNTYPILHLERTAGLDNQDQLHAIEVRMRASAGANLQIETTSQEKFDWKQTEEIARAFAWEISTPIRPGAELNTYILTKPRPLPASQIRHLLVRPTDAAGATFAIESVRLIFRKEHLAGIQSGVSWQGMSEIYRESLVGRAPETIRLSVELPDSPWLDLALGTVDERPVTFRVGINRGRGLSATGAETALLEQTVTTPYRWEAKAIDLGAFAGESVTISLSLASEQSGAVGVWGSPVVRHRGAMPAVDVGRDEVAPGPGLGRTPQGVILIWVDTLRRDHLDVYGYGRPTAPAIRRMAAEGTLFKNSTSQATWTKVSSPSVMTSLYPSSHGVLDFPDHLPASATTIAEVYRAAGYATLSFASNLFTGQFTALHQGFEELHEDGSLPSRRSSKTAREYVDRLLPWLERHRDDAFFVFLHLYDPHDPYEPQPPYDSLWADASKKQEHTRHAEQVKKFIAEPLAKAFGMPSREELLKAGLDPDAYVAHDRDWYDGSIRGLDAEIARIQEQLRALGLEGKTLVVFTADHGEEFLEHGRMFHGQTVYGELTQVPLVVLWPGVVRKGVVEETTQTIDLMPTLLDISRLPHPKGLQGKSLVPLLSRQEAGGAQAAAGWESRPAISEKAFTKGDFGAPWPTDTESYSIVDGSWKLIHNRTRPRGGPEYELYDFHKDPLNKVDVAARHPEQVARLAKALEGWRRMAAAARLKPDSEGMKGLSREQLERLRSLGYIR